MNLNFADGSRVTSIGTIAGSSSGTQVVASGTPHTKGAYTQITAATTVDIHGFWMRSFNNDDGNLIIDIAIGAGGSEQIIVPDYFIWSGQAHSIFFPISVPAGTRMAVRAQSQNASQAIDIAFYGISGSPRRQYGGWRCQQGGAINGSTTLTSTDPGAVANVLSGWTQLVASTSYVGRYLIVNSTGNPSTSLRSRTLVDVGVGTVGNEAPYVFQIMSTGKDFLPFGLQTGIGFDLDLPAGSRISVRSQASTGTSPTRLSFHQVLMFG